MRRVVADWIEERRRTGAHQRRRIWQKELAEAAVSDEKFLGLGGVLGGEGKRGEGCLQGALYARGCVEKGLGFEAWRGIDGLG
jgi:hypothetical protein